MTDRALRLLRRRKSVKALGSITFGWQLLLAAILLNIAAALVNAIEVAIYACTQDRSVDGFSYYRAADVAAPVLTGAAGVTSQIILTLRCYKVVKRGMLVLTLLGIGLCASFSGAIWMTVSAYPLMGPDAASLDTTNIYYASELWLWSSVGVDLAITGLLSVHLRALKQGFSSRTDGYVNSMIRLTFETFLVPTIVNIAAAVIYIATYQNYVLINWSLLAQREFFARLSRSHTLTSLLLIPQRVFRRYTSSRWYTASKARQPDNGDSSLALQARMARHECPRVPS